MYQTSCRRKKPSSAVEEYKYTHTHTHTHTHTQVVQNIGVLKNLLPWDISWSGALKYFSSWNIEKWRIVLNILKHSDQKNLTKKIHTQFSVPKCINTPILYATDAHFYNPAVKIGSISFFSSSDT